MKYQKVALTIPQQIALLESRGMQIPDKSKAQEYLFNISYYRLSAYWYTFLENPKETHQFKPNTNFNQVIDTYVFDKKLRLLLFDKLERLEIALRTQLIYHYSHEFGANWYEQPSLFRNQRYCQKLLELLQDEMRRTNEDFISHYQNKYSAPENPPSWMVLELASFGQLSMLYKNLRRTPSYKKVADHFKLPDRVLVSWLEALSFVRNTCAHHSRLWNRKLPKTPLLPKNPGDIWLENLPSQDRHNRIYIILSSVAYLIRQINSDTSYPRKLKELLESYPQIPLHYMGFPESWETEALWQ